MRTRARLTVPTCLAVVVLAGCGSAAGPGLADADSLNDVVRLPDAPTRDAAVDVAMAVDTTHVPGVCHNVSFFLVGCTHAVDYPDGAEIRGLAPISGHGSPPPWSPSRLGRGKSTVGSSR